MLMLGRIAWWGSIMAASFQRGCNQDFGAQGRHCTIAQAIESANRVAGITTGRREHDSGLAAVKSLSASATTSAPTMAPSSPHDQGRPLANGRGAHAASASEP